MDPTVVAAWIAAGVSVLTLAGTLTAQYLSYRASSRGAEKTAEEQRQQLDRTLAEQSQHLDRTLAEQNQQLDRTLAEQRTRTLNERFATAAEQMGTDKPAVQLAGVYAMAGLADDWPGNRQTCVDVLCAYLRMPYAPDPGQDAPRPELLAFRAFREVRHTVIRVITAHLQDDAGKESWQGLNFDFTGAVFDGGDFRNALFPAGTVEFRRTQFSSGLIDFRGARFSGSDVDFVEAQFSGGRVNFSSTEFSGGLVDFTGARLSDGEVSFSGARLSRGEVYFIGTEFSGGRADFTIARFSGSEVSFIEAQFSDGKVGFHAAEFSGGIVGFSGARFSGGEVSFRGARFSGGIVSLSSAVLVGGMVDFSEPGDWSCPPTFPWTDAPPSSVMLPKKDQPKALQQPSDFGYRVRRTGNRVFRRSGRLPGSTSARRRWPSSSWCRRYHEDG
jgi:uncharacterized protein YjbI with pentapeptide repeats